MQQFEYCIIIYFWKKHYLNNVGFGLFMGEHAVYRHIRIIIETHNSPCSWNGKRGFCSLGKVQMDFVFLYIYDWVI